MSPELKEHLTRIETKLDDLLALVRSHNKPKRIPNGESAAPAWIAAGKLVKAFSEAFPETYKMTGAKNKAMELRAAKDLLASGETAEGLVALAKANARSEFNGYRAQSATLYLLQKNLCAIKVRQDGLIKPHKPYVPRQAQEGEWEGTLDYRRQP